jgi:hypothetical protein
MLIFLDFDGVLRPAAGSPLETSGLVTALGPLLSRIQFVITAPDVQEWELEEIRGLFPSGLATQIIGSVWDPPPPVPLAPYDRIRFWLARRYVLRTPSWFALCGPVVAWPERHERDLIRCARLLETRSAQAGVSGRLSGLYLGNTWWGRGDAPSQELCDRATALMCAWSVPRRLWSTLLGAQREEFERRIELLLTIHATVRVREDAGRWLPHWVLLPKSGLGMQRPLDVMASGGVEGLQTVLALVARGTHADPPDGKA